MAERCEAMMPSTKTTRPSQCERPNGHRGPHSGIAWSGNIKVYPSQWYDDEVPFDVGRCPGCQNYERDQPGGCEHLIGCPNDSVKRDDRTFLPPRA